MKKILSLFLMLIFILSIASCSKPFTGESEASKEAVSADESTYYTDSTDSTNSTDNNDSSESTDTRKSSIAPLLWKVTSKESEAVLWLFGACDRVGEQALLLPDAVINAYESSENLLVETNEYDDKVDFQKLYKQFQYSDGTTIVNHIPEELYQKASQIITDALGSSGVYNYKPYNPTYWTMLIRNIYLLDSPLTKNVNEYFITKAGQDGKHIACVESLEAYYKRYIDLPEEVQLFQLKQITNLSSDEYLKQKINFNEAWAAGASGYIEKSIYNTDGYTKDELPLIKQYNKIFYEDINKEIAKLAKEYLSLNTTVFACINIEHLVGEKGVVTLLTEAGYTVEKINTRS